MTSIADGVRAGMPAGDGVRAGMPAGDGGGTGRDLGHALALAALALARRFADGATLWCLAPEWPEHARHVAVEFVHPVVVGKRALPAVSVSPSNPVATLRAAVRAGDVVLVVSRRDEPVTHSVLRRAQAWGASTIWLGAGEVPTGRPGEASADHIVWVDDDGDATAQHDGRLVLLYHVLWELTHVCFEHPGLLTTADPADCDEGEACITCSDEGRLGEVIGVVDFATAKVRTARGVEMIDTTIVDPLLSGDLVLIHAGAAITVLP